MHSGAVERKRYAFRRSGKVELSAKEGQGIEKLMIRMERQGGALIRKGLAMS